jgi:hypothetical protein
MQRLLFLIAIVICGRISCVQHSARRCYADTVNFFSGGQDERT